MCIQCHRSVDPGSVGAFQFSSRTQSIPVGSGKRSGNESSVGSMSLRLWVNRALFIQPSTVFKGYSLLYQNARGNCR